MSTDGKKTTDKSIKLQAKFEIAMTESTEQLKDKTLQTELGKYLEYVGKLQRHIDTFMDGTETKALEVCRIGNNVSLWIIPEKLSNSSEYKGSFHETEKKSNKLTSGIPDFLQNRLSIDAVINNYEGRFDEMYSAVDKFIDNVRIQIRNENENKKQKEDKLREKVDALKELIGKENA